MGLFNKKNKEEKPEGLPVDPPWAPDDTQIMKRLMHEIEAERSEPFGRPLYYEPTLGSEVSELSNLEHSIALPEEWRHEIQTVITNAIADWQRDGNGPNSYNPNERGGLPQTTIWIDKADQFGRAAALAVIEYLESHE